MIDPSDLMGPNLEVRNSKGEVIFAMKRKDQHGPTYYLFEKHEDRMGSDEDRAKFDHAFSVIKMMARRSGFPFYDMKEINEAITAQMNAVRETAEFTDASRKLDEDGGRAFIKDISFKVFDHTTERINTLTVGVSIMPIGDLAPGQGDEE